MNAQDVPTIKIIICGGYGVGKTSLAKRLVNEEVTPQYDSTVGVDFKVRKYPLKIKDQGDIMIQWVIWDLAGHWRFTEITSSFFKGAEAGMLVFDLPRPKTLETLNRWVDRLLEELDQPIPLILVGNKVDWRKKSSNVCIPKEDAINFAKEVENRLGSDFTVPYIETSAKNDTNVSKAFNKLITLYKESKSKKSS